LHELLTKAAKFSAGTEIPSPCGTFVAYCHGLFLQAQERIQRLHEIQFLFLGLEERPGALPTLHVL
jgi:hypothetical protein